MKLFLGLVFNHFSISCIFYIHVAFKYSFNVVLLLKGCSLHSFPAILSRHLMYMSLAVLCFSVSSRHVFTAEIRAQFQHASRSSCGGQS
jgi:hypothetical protein